MLMLLVLVLAGFLGIELIRKIPSQLHTPLMSGSNAISGITIFGAIVATALDGPVSQVLAALAVAAAMANVVGGYLVTSRMLAMFSAKPKPHGKSGGAS
ncbi:MAG: NAD(P) transhydrogenase subunit alpha [Phycisphaerae bacterium]|nr:NAD(P) transhydrogenase subunit alpha [Phycisphaerae bacterium]